jgi:tetratricopeptide (TPR) repeat protein
MTRKQDDAPRNPYPSGAGFVPAVLGLAALFLYAFTAAPIPVPGRPASTLAGQLGLSPLFFPAQDAWWGLLLRHVPGDPNTWATAIAVVCGAFCVWAASLLVGRVRPAIGPVRDGEDQPECSPAAATRARRLAAACAGLFAMGALPVWILSTRSLPGICNLAFLLVATLVFSEYQRAGKPWRLCLFGFLYGIGVTVSETFILFAPFAALLVVRAMLQRAEFSTRNLVFAGLCAIPPLFLYFLHAAVLFSLPAAAVSGFLSRSHLLVHGILRAQLAGIIHAQPLQGLFLMLALCLIPWIILFLFRPKESAWRFGIWSIFLRWFILAALVGVAFALPYSPWNFTGPENPIPLPYLLMGASVGLIAGDFSLMRSRHRESVLVTSIRFLSRTAAWCVPLVLVAAVAWNFPAADGRAARRLAPMVDAIFDAAGNRDVILSTGPFDDLLRLEAARHGAPLHIVTLPATKNAAYRDFLARDAFPSPRAQSLLAIGFQPFLRDFLMSPDGLARTTAIDTSEELRACGYLVPDRLLFLAVPSEDDLDFDALLAVQRPFRAAVAAFADRPLSPRNPVTRCERYAIRLAAKVANDIGYLRAERGDLQAALDDFAEARHLDPSNISALFNQISATESLKSPDFETYKAEWEKMQPGIDRRVLWNLGDTFGYVHDTGFLARRGMLYAVSGKPRNAEAEFRRAAGNAPLPPAVKATLARAYLQSGDIAKGESFYLDALAANPRNADAIQALLAIDLSQGRLDSARERLAALDSLGVPAERLRFERALLLYASGDAPGAADALQSYLRDNNSDIRAWAFLASLFAHDGAGISGDRAARAIDTLRAQAEKTANPQLRLILAELYLSQSRFEPARAELDSLVRMNPRLPAIWELYLRLDLAERRQDLAEEHANTLLSIDPRNAVGNRMMGTFQFQRGHYALAESSFRTALAAKREPATLNDLAYLLCLRKSDLGEALALVTEALAASPANPVFLSTRAEILIQLSRLDEAEADIRAILRDWPDNAQILFLAAKLYAARGDRAAAFRTADSLTDRLSELDPEQQDQLNDILRDTRP